jgi:stage II sporulation protein GA (sporulation sigma-E factor processing peptidase)
MRLGDETVLEVYVDVVLLLNLVLNGLALWGTGRLFRLRVRARRIFGGALLGAVYALAVYFWPWGFADSMIMKFAVAAAMIWSVYGKQPLRVALRLILGFYLVSFAMGGAVAALTAQKSGIVRLLGISAACVGAAAGIARWVGARRLREKWIWPCRLTDLNQRTEFRALLDTGNRLEAFLTGEPVVILERRAAPFAERERKIWREVPFQTAGREKGMFMAFEPEKFEVYTGNGWKEIGRVLVALSDTVLDREDRYQGLLPFEILNEMGEFHGRADEKTNEKADGRMDEQDEPLDEQAEGGIDQGMGLFEEPSYADAVEAESAGGH